MPKDDMLLLGSHDSRLINLALPYPHLRKKSFRALLEEMKRTAEGLGIHGFGRDLKNLRALRLFMEGKKTDDSV